MCCSVRIANMRVYVPLYADIGSIETNIKSTRQTMRKNNRSVEMFLNTAHKRTDGIQRGGRPESPFKRVVEVRDIFRPPREGRIK